MFYKHKYLVRQYVAVLTANLSSLCAGLGFAWFSPVLVKLMDPKEKMLSKILTDQEASWIVSTAYLAGCFTNYPGGIAVDYFGRKFCITTTLFLTLIIELMLTFATEAWMFIIGKAVCGALRGTMLCATTSFCAEISNKEIRGSLISIVSSSLGVGILLMYCIGPYLNYTHLSIAYCCTILACIIPILYIPESPYHLFSKGRVEECKEVLAYFKGSEQAITEEIKQYYLESAEKKISNLELLKDKTLYKPIAITIVFAFLTQMIGYSVITNYLQLILEISGTNIKTEMSSAIAGVIQFVSGILAAFIIDKVGRKILFFLSLPGIAAGMVGLGAFFKLKELEYTIDGWINYLPLFSVLSILFWFGMGPGALIFAVASELFEGPARATGVSISFTVSNISAFLVTKYFSYLAKIIGFSYSFWLFAFNSIVMCLFVFFFIPETKGKTFSEIQNDLRQKNSEESVVTRV